MMRIALTLAVIALAFPAAVYIHERHTFFTYTAPGCSPYFDKNCERSIEQHPSWEDPAAVGIALGSLAIGAGIVGYRRSPG